MEVKLYAFLTFGLQSQAGRSGHKKILTLLGIEM
jgi:hypothetical protein